MKDIIVTDDGGDEMTCVEHNGYLLPKFMDPQGVETLDSVQIREDDVIIATFPKSGTHWMFEITRELVSGQILEDDITMGQSFMEMVSKDSLDELSSPRILATHVKLQQLPADVKKKKPKIILVHRNLKDVAVSFYLFLKKMPIMKYNGKWENFLTPFVEGKSIYGSWFDYVRSWDQVKEDNPGLPILNLYYEDMKEMRRMCNFLDLKRSDEFLQTVCENTSIETMRSQKVGKGKELMFRKGQIGDWKNWFTVAQNEWFDRKYQEKIRAISHPIKFT